MKNQRNQKNQRKKSTARIKAVKKDAWKEENALLEKAIAFAVERHAGQLRKGTTIPYIVHPLEVMNILISMDADAALVIAGVLHDIVEDTGTSKAEIEELFGSDVAELVAAHSEDKSKSWEERKTRAILEAQEAPTRLKMLILADKVSNLRSLDHDFWIVGEDLWKRFNAGVEKQSWYYNEMQEALEELEWNPKTAAVYGEMMDLYKDVFIVYVADEKKGMLYQMNATGVTLCLKKGNPQWKPFDGVMGRDMQILSREQAEWLENRWNEPFWKTVEKDLKDGKYQSAENPVVQVGTWVVGLSNGELAFSGTMAGAEPGSGPLYTLDESSTGWLLTRLRIDYGTRRKLPEIFERAFGGKDPELSFHQYCDRNGIELEGEE